MEKFLKNALLTGTALIGFGIGNQELKGQTPGEKGKAPSGQEIKKPMSEKEASLRVDLAYFMTDPIANEQSILEIEEMLKEFEPSEAVKTENSEAVEKPHD